MAGWRAWTGLMLLGLTLACGGDDETPPQGPKGTQIDCTWFEGDNCYKQALASAKSCLPDDAALGTLSAAGDRCTYASGHTVTFNKPVDLQASDDRAWDFDVTTSAGQCLGYHETSGGFRLVTPNGTFIEDSSRGALQLTCPDGSQFYMANVFEALNCGFQNLPGYATSSSSNSVVFSFIGATDGGLSVFECRH
jgi:hypothetical protein